MNKVDSENYWTKPQDDFIDMIDNSYNPFVPLIKEKYFNKYPIPTQLIALQKEYEADPKKYREVVLRDNKKENNYYPHPYEKELRELVYIPEQLSPSVPRIEIKDINEFPWRLIDKPEDLKYVVDTLSGIKEFSVDLQNYTYRSFLGMTCLMSITTSTETFLIDSLKLWKSMNIMQKVFADPSIVKVFLGSELDIKYLQRDFGIYVINMFDVVKAALILGSTFSGNPLPYLLKEMCDITLEQIHQYSDWRARPIPYKMIRYAKQASHYLLYMYNELKIQLINKTKEKTSSNLFVFVELAFNRSKEISCITYRKPDLKDFNYFKIFKNNLLKGINKKVLKSLYKLRDYIARVEDESVDYICSNDILAQIAKVVPVLYTYIIIVEIL